MTICGGWCGHRNTVCFAIQSGRRATRRRREQARRHIQSINGSFQHFKVGYVDTARHYPSSWTALSIAVPEGTSRAIVAMAKVIPGQEIVRHSDVMTWLRQQHAQKDRSRYFRVGTDTLAWKLPDFVIDPGEVDGLLNRAHSFQNLVLDLRGNPGGLRAAMDKFIGGFFQRDIKVGEMREQKQSEEAIAKSRGSKAFTGKLIVLIDSRSGSAAEIFARVVQLEKRGPSSVTSRRAQSARPKTLYTQLSWTRPTLRNIGPELRSRTSSWATARAWRIGVTPTSASYPHPQIWLQDAIRLGVRDRTHWK